jgi:hypothetical protein
VPFEAFTILCVSVNLLSTSVRPIVDETSEAVFRFSRNLKGKEFTKNCKPIQLSFLSYKF